MLSEGKIIEGPFWPEPIEIKKVENYGDYVHIVGSTDGKEKQLSRLDDFGVE